MKKVFLLTGAMLALTVAVASAAPGINLNWDDCTLGAFQSNKVDACLSNFGAPNQLVVSVAPDGQIANMNGAQGLIDVQVDAAALGNFWHLEVGGCRAGNLAANVGIGSATPPFSCPEPWSPGTGGPGGQAGSAGFTPFDGGDAGPDRGRIRWIIAVPGETDLDSNIAPDWYLIGINLLRGGTTTCAGCLTPACLVANQIRITKPAGTIGGDVFITTPANSQHVTWQGGGTLSCPAATPTQSSSWGQIKSMYR